MQVLENKLLPCNEIALCAVNPYMKKFIFLLLLPVVFLSCKKESDEKKFMKAIAGTWELEKYMGGWSPVVNYPIGNGNLLVLSKDGSYKRMKHDTLIVGGSFSIKKSTSCGSEEFLFVTSDQQTNDLRVDLTGLKLGIGASMCIADGSSSIYRKVE